MNAVEKFTSREAKLPLNYEEAKRALAECARIDECKKWADKAEAIASYAKQADDQEMQIYARRIRARAVDRIGELAEEIPPGKTGPKSSVGAALPNPGRMAVAEAAGLSKDQLVTALRVHNVPREGYCKYCYTTHRNWWLMDRRDYLFDDDESSIVLCGRCRHTSRWEFCLCTS